MFSLYVFSLLVRSLLSFEMSHQMLYKSRFQLCLNVIYALSIFIKHHVQDCTLGGHLQLHSPMNREKGLSPWFILSVVINSSSSVTPLLTLPIYPFNHITLIWRGLHSYTMYNEDILFVERNVQLKMDYLTEFTLLILMLSLCKLEC